MTIILFIIGIIATVGGAYLFKIAYDSLTHPVAPFHAKLGMFIMAIGSSMVFTIGADWIQ